MRKVVFFVAGISLSLLALVVAAPAGAATIQVETDLDQLGGPSPIGQEPLCSLREAVQAANTDADFDGCERVGTGTADTIVLAGGVTYARSRSGPAVIADDTNSGGDLDITGETEISVVGPGKATIDGNDLDRVITIHAGASLRAAKLEIRDGLTNDVGGGIYTRLSDLTLVKSTVADNSAGVGGGIYASGSNTIVKASTLAGNSAFTGPLPPGAPPDLNLGGGALNVTDNGVLGMTNSTISGNQTDDVGGGIKVESGSVKLNAVTVTRNEANHGGGLFGDAPFTNSIVAENVGGDCASPLGRRSLVGRETGCDQSANAVTFDPDLRPLGDYGGPTPTHALEARSPAIGLAGASAPPRDQRGRKRDDEPDSGAFER